MAAPSTSKAPGRPRSDATHRAILNAAVDMLLECEDYRLVSIDKIAARAKVGKQSIYRWWSSKADLILEALTCRTQHRAPLEPFSSDAFADLVSFLKRIFALMHEPVANKAVRILIAEAQFNSEFQKKFWEVFLSPGRTVLHEILARGIALGQFRPDLDVETVLEVLYGAYWYRLLSGTPAPCDDAFAETIVRLLAPGIARTPDQARVRPLPAGVFEA
jgi:AcrR family transcriptional regulator